MRKFLLLLTVFLAGFLLPQGFAQTTVYPTGVTTADFGDNVAVDNLGNFYATMTAAIGAANGNEAITALYCKENAASTKLANAHTKITKSLTIEGNGITFNSDVDPHMSVNGGTLNLTIRNAKNCYVWGQIKDTGEQPGTRNIVLENCTNIGTSGGNQAGRLVYLTGQGADYITNITIQNCEIGHTDSPIYSNTNGTIRIEHCNIHDCAVPININYKSNDGVQNVYVIDNTIDNCGWTTGDLATYAAPIRVVHTVAGSTQNVYISSNTVTNTIGSKGDVLLVDDRAGKTVIDNTAEISGNATDLVVLAKPIVPMQTVAANTTATVAGGPTFPAGNGSIATPYEIRTKEDLITLASAVNGGTTFSGKYFLQMADIDLENMEWTPIGTVTPEGAPEKKFSGIYEGNNKTIFNLKVTSTAKGVGLFGKVDNGTIKNLTLTNVDVSSTERQVGALIGAGGYATCNNITLNGTVSVTGLKQVGGLVGINCGNMDNCKVISPTGNVTSTENQAGGVIGYFYSSFTISNCVANINVAGGTKGVAGGVIGRLGDDEPSTVIHCTSLGGNITVPNNIGTGYAHSGSILGDLLSANHTVKHCYGNANAEYPVVGGYYDNSYGSAEHAAIVFNDNAWNKNISSAFNTDNGVVPFKGITEFTTRPRNNNLIFSEGELAGMDIVADALIVKAQGATVSSAQIREYVESVGIFSVETVGTTGDTLRVVMATFEGDGSAANPYIIDSKMKLKLLAHLVNNGDASVIGKKFLQTANIDLENEEWTPIGTASNPFRSDYDGGNDTIFNLKCTTLSGRIGLFGKTEQYPIEIWRDIRNLTIDGATIACQTAGNEYTGVVAGETFRTNYTNVHVRNASVVGGKYVGGLIGHYCGTMNNCSFESGTVTGDYQVGGLTGYTQYATISNCTVNASSITGRTVVGGISARLNATSSLLHCSVTCNNIVSEDNTYGGAIVGQILDNAHIVKYNYSNSNCTLPLLGAWYSGQGTVARSESIFTDNSWNKSLYNSDDANIMKDGSVLTTRPRFDSLVFFRSELAGLAFNPGDKIRVAQGAQLTAQEVADSIAERTGLFTGTVAEDGYTVTVTAAEFDGTGTEADPYIIDNWGKLMLLASRVNSGTTYSGAYFKQTADIDLNRIADWTPIGGVADGSAINNTRTFLGRYDGYGHTISNLTITTVRHQNGLFGAIGLSNGESGCYVKNLNIANAHVAGGSSAAVLCGICKDTRFDSIRITSSEVNADKYVAGIAGHCGATTITNCTVEVKITCSDNQAAGISAYTYGGSVVSNCVATVDITALESAGGVVGRLNDDAASILHCTSFGTVRATTTSTTDPHSGSILGDVYGTGAHHVQHCYGNATAEYPIVGAWRSGNNGTAERSNAIFVANSWDKAVFATDSAEILQNRIVLTKRPRNNNLVFYRSELDGMEVAPGATIVIAQGSALSGQEVIDTIQARTGIFSGTLSVTGDTITVTMDDFAGSGTEADPYIIDSKGKLMLLAYKVNNGNTYMGKYFKQTEDIDLENMEWTPIGGLGHSFGGRYDGQEKTISNLKITTVRDYNGLFGYTTNGGAYVINLNISGAEIHGGKYVSAVAGYGFVTTFRNIHVTDAEIHSNRYTGGIVGFIDVSGTVDSCSFNGTIECTGDKNGGIVGSGYGLHITNCEANVDIRGDFSAGGIMGCFMATDGTIAHCTVHGTVEATARGAGGIIGEIVNGTSTLNRQLRNNYSDAAVAGSPDRIIVGGWYDNTTSATEEYTTNMLNGNAWNKGKYNADSYEIAQNGDNITISRNPNVIYSTDEIDDLTAGVVIIAQGSELTTQDVLDAVASNPLYIASINGDGNVVIAMAVAMIGTEAYPSLAAALATVPTHTPTTVKLLQNASLTSDEVAQSLIANKTITFTADLDADAHPQIHLTITKAGQTVITPASSNFTFENLILDHITGGVTCTGMQHISTLTVNHCTITGFSLLYAPTATFNDCDMIQTTYEYTFWSYGSNATFNRCNFIGQGKTVNVYRENNTDTMTVTFNQCLFKSDPPITDKAAIQLNSQLSPFKVIINDCTQEGFDVTYGVPGMGGLLNDKTPGPNTTVYQDDVRILPEFDGLGTQGNPYLIPNKEKLATLSLMVNGGRNYNGKYFLQTADIDLNSEEFTPIGTVAHPFRGHYNGNNKTISNLTIHSTEANTGLFGYVTGNCYFRDLTLSNVDVQSTNRPVGALVGWGQFVDCKNITLTGNVSVTGLAQVGGLFGHVSGTIDSCSCISPSGQITALENQAGGVVGYGYGGVHIINCFAHVNVKAIAEGAAGGVVGRMQENNSVISHCTSLGGNIVTEATNPNYARSGSILGDLLSDGNHTVRYCYGIASAEYPLVGGYRATTGSVEHATSTFNDNAWDATVFNTDQAIILKEGAQLTTRPRSNDLVFYAREIDNITIADGAVIVRAQGAEATTEQILAKIAESGLFTATSSVTGDTITVHVGTFAGSGTEADPYIIDSKGKLMLLAYMVNNVTNYQGKYFKQTADIDLENEEWDPIGGGDETIDIVNPFKGKYDGDNHTISNLKNTSTRDEVGLFGCVHDAEIKNLNMDGVTLNGNRVVGAVAGKFYTSTMTNVHVTNAYIDARSAYVGGLVGHGYGTFRNCSYQGNVYAYNGQAGGIAGSGGFSFYDCVVDGQIGGWYWIGGICGNLQDGSGYVSHCTVSGLVYCKMIYYNGGAGGIIGSALYNYQRSIDNNYCNAEVKNWDEDNEQWVHSDCPVIGGYNSQGPVDPDNLKLSNNSWNHTIFPINTMNVIELDDEVVIPGSQPRNPNLVFSIEEALGVTEGEVILAQGAQATNDNIIAAVDDMPEYSYYINDRGNVVVVPNPARIDETYYTSIQAAIDAAQNGDEITILTDVDYENPFTSTSYTTILTVPAGKDITIDFNGHTVKASVDTYQNAYILTNRGTLTLIDRTAAETTDYANGEGGGFEMHSSVIENGTYGTQTDAIDNVGTLNINSGRVVAVNDAVLEAGQGYNLTYSIHAGQGTLNVNGGYIYGYAASIYQGVFNGNTSIVNIHGGEVVGRTSGIQTKMWGNVILNIDGGLVKGTRNDAIYCSDGATPFIQEINISGGKLEGANEAICNFWANTTGTISGGELIGGYGLYEYPYYGFATGVTSTWNITGGSITALEDEPENYAVFIRAFRPSRVEISDNAVINGAMVSTHKVGDNWVENTTDYLFPVGGYYQVDPVTYVADGDTTRLNIGAAEYEDYYVVVPFVNLTVNSSATPNNFTVKNITDDAHIETLAENVPTFSGRVPSGARIEVTAAETIGTDWFLGWNDNESARTRTIVPTRDTTIKALYGSVTATADTAFFSLPLGIADTIVPASWFDPSLIRVSDVSVDKVLAYVISGGNNYPYGGEESRVAGNGTIEVVWKIFQSGTNNLLCTATQVLKAVYTNCGEEITDDDNNTYNTVLMGSQCWMASNLRTNIAGSRYYNDDAENAVFGRLYNWYTAVGLTLTRSGEPVPVPDANGHVQGICPDGWRLPSVQDIHNLRTSVSSEYELRSPDYWVEAGAGTSPADGYNLLPGGSFDANANRFDGLYAAARLWTWETSSTSTMPFYGCATGACPDMEVLTTSRFSMMSVRCVKK